MRMLLALPLFLLAACASITPEQISAMASQSGALCVTGATWNGSPASVQYTSFGGKSVGTAGGGGVAECGAAKFTFNNEGKVQPAVPAK